MPTFRPELDSITPYQPGRGEREILREYGLEAVVKLASNESPLPPFPAVIEAIRREAAGVNRYPETTYHDLGNAVAAHLEVRPENLWFGGGGVSLLLNTALAVGGPGTSIVFADPSFVAYRLATAVSGAEAIPVPLDAEHRHDLDAMAAAVRPDTTLVYVCNPNNPTATHVPTSDVRRLITSLPERVLVVVDEAYHEYVDRPDYESMASEAATSPNLVVMRTFSKVYGLAGLRVGYLVGHPDVLAALRRTQLPFTVSGLAQAAATEALRHPDEVERRLRLNAAGRAQLLEGLRARNLAVTDSVASFIYLHPGIEPRACTEALLRRGVIVRPTGSPWIRVSVGTEKENQVFLEALDAVLGEPR